MHFLLTFHFSGHDLTDKWVPVIQIPAFDKIVTRFFVGVLSSVKSKIVSNRFLLDQISHIRFCKGLTAEILEMTFSFRKFRAVP